MYKNYLFSYIWVEYLIKYLLYLRVYDTSVIEMLVDGLLASRDISKVYIV